MLTARIYIPEVRFTINGLWALRDYVSFPLSARERGVHQFQSNLRSSMLKKQTFC
jgi:hypothetical protein